MNIAVIGGGGREHAIIRSLKRSNDVSHIYALPGNGGIAEDAECVAIGAKDLDAIVDFAVEKARLRCRSSRRSASSWTRGHARRKGNSLLRSK